MTELPAVHLPWYARFEPSTYGFAKEKQVISGKLLCEVLAKYCTESSCFGDAIPDEDVKSLYDSVMRDIQKQSTQETVNPEICATLVDHLLLMFNCKEEAVSGKKKRRIIASIPPSYDAAKAIAKIDSYMGKKPVYRIGKYMAAHRKKAKVVLASVFGCIALHFIGVKICGNNIPTLPEEKTGIGDWFKYSVLHRERPLPEISKWEVWYNQLMLIKPWLMMAALSVIVFVLLMRILLSKFDRMNNERQYLNRVLTYEAERMKREWQL